MSTAGKGRTQGDPELLVARTHGQSRQGLLLGGMNSELLKTLCLSTKLQRQGQRVRWPNSGPVGSASLNHMD